MHYNVSFLLTAVRTHVVLPDIIFSARTFISFAYQRLDRRITLVILGLVTLVIICALDVDLWEKVTQTVQSLS